MAVAISSEPELLGYSIVSRLAEKKRARKVAPKTNASIPLAYDFDQLVIGSGPAGQRAAIQSAKLGKRTAIVEANDVVGGVCINTGTLPSKSLRQACLHLSGFQERSVYGASYAVKKDITMNDLLFRTDMVIRNELEVIRHQLRRNGVEIISATASFIDPHTLLLDRPHQRSQSRITAEKITIAVGTQTSRPGDIPFDGQRLFTSDDILSLQCLPSSLAVIGAGVIGCEYATIFAALGVRVTLIDSRRQLLDFVDQEIVDALVYHMRQNRITLRLGEAVAEIELSGGGKSEHVEILLHSGKHVHVQKALYSIGRMGATESMNLDAIGLKADPRGRLTVNENFQTAQSHIYAVGDVIGFPSLASTSMEQGRMAACHAFGAPMHSVPEHFPFGIYTIPEISVVGRNEEQLTLAEVPYEVGKAHYRESARGQIIGDEAGMLKLLFHLETRKLLGVSIFGNYASELIHIGQAVLVHGGSIDYFVDAVYNYPTLAECYKTAAFDGVNRLV